MLTLPDEYNPLFAHMQPFCSKRVWKLAVVLLVGAILVPGKRTVNAEVVVIPFQQRFRFSSSTSWWMFASRFCSYSAALPLSTPKAASLWMWCQLSLSISSLSNLNRSRNRCSGRSFAFLAIACSEVSTLAFRSDMYDCVLLCKLRIPVSRFPYTVL